LRTRSYRIKVSILNEIQGVLVTARRTDLAEELITGEGLLYSKKDVNQIYNEAKSGTERIINAIGINTKKKMNKIKKESLKLKEFKKTLDKETDIKKLDKLGVKMRDYGYDIKYIFETDIDNKSYMNMNKFK